MRSTILPFLALLTLAACDGAGARADRGAASSGADPGAARVDAVALDRGDRWAEARAAGQGTVTVLYVPADGFAYAGSDGRLTGVTVEIMREFATWVERTHDVRVELDFVAEEDWQVFYGRVRDGEGGVFGLGNVTITEPRREELAFSPPYLTNVAVLITRSDTPELARPADLAATFRGLEALAFRGTLHQERLERLRRDHAPELAMDLAGSNQEILDRVAEGGYFAYIDAYNYWRARDQGAPLRHHPVADDPAEAFGIIMPRGSDWHDLMVDFFGEDDAFRSTATYRRILVEHLGERLTEVLEAARGR